MRVLSLFSGIGAFEKALSKKIKYELVNYCEFDKHASKAYSLIHNVPEQKNLGDITQINVDTLPRDLDLVTYGFPCQDISVAGKQHGFEHQGKQTRSGLFFNASDIVKKTQPKVAICENVKNLTSKKFVKEFKTVLATLEKAGYNNYWKVLNSVDYGVPQWRQRVFIISIRKDIDDGKFQFPTPIPLLYNVKDKIEHNVDDKYYKVCPSMLQALDSGKVKDITNSEYCNTLTTKQARWNNAGLIQDNKGYRYLTPRECFRFMGFEDKDVETLINNGVSDYQLYKMAGNSIVVNVLEAIISKLHKYLN